MNGTDIISDFVLSLRCWRDSIPFIREHKLWRGFHEHRIVYYLLIAVALILGLKFFGHTRGLISEGLESPGQISLAAFNTVKDMAGDMYSFMTLGAYKYLVLVLLELFIFHIAIVTLRILKGVDMQLTMKEFMHAQIRMIKVVLLSYILETVFTAIVGIPLGIANLGFLKPVAALIIQSFFFGFVLIDNYHEITGTGIKESFNTTWRHFFGAATGIGMVMYLLLLIPVIGTILAPLIGVVAATLTMYRIKA